MEDIVGIIEHEIADQYLNDENPRPWIIAFSGGKDSTMLLQLVWNCVNKLPPGSRKRPVYVICNNTLVENPKILKFVENQLRLIKTAAIEQSMPITVDHTIPSLQDTYWVNLIGRGYPAPNTTFRWCTDRLKIKPTTRYIQNKVSNWGEVIILLGTRKEESDTRARSIRKFEVKGKRLSKHSLPNAYVYAPLKELTTKEVWQYLLQNESPWKSDHADLRDLYQVAANSNAELEMDAPLITDLNVPPTGNSRFGCWVCTLVKTDKCMQSLIENGEDWMRPLLEFRNLLAKTIDRDDPEYEPEKYRMPIRRNTQEGLGPYWPRWRKHILQELLRAQEIIQQHSPEIQLITQQELATIQVLWYRDFIYEYNVSDIYSDIYGEQVDFDKSSESIRKEKLLLKEVCNKNPSDYELINNLLRAHKNRVLLVTKRGLQKDIENLLNEYLSPSFTDVYKKDKY